MAINGREMYPLFLLLFLCSASTLGAQLQLTTIGEVKRLPPNSSVLFPCQVVGEFSPYHNQIVWTKRSELTPSDEDGQQINMATLLREPFHSTGRFSMILTESDAGVSIDLNITNLRVEDDGVYTCQVLDASGPVAGVSHSLTVPVAVDSLQLLSNDSWQEQNGTKKVFQFQDLTDSYLTCQSVGGNPKPTLHVTRAGSEITSELEKVEHSSDPIGSVGLQRVEHQVQLVTWKFRASREDAGKRLRCVAKIPRSPELRTSVSGYLDVTFAPMFNCTGPLYVSPSTTNLTASCWVRAHPLLYRDAIYWTIGTTNITNISTGGNNTKYITTVKEVDAQWTIMTLTINSVNTTDYNTYTLHVENPVSARHHDVTVTEATTTQSTTTTSTTTTSAPPPTVRVKDTPDKPAEAIPGAGVVASTCPILILLFALLTVTCQ